MAAKKARVTSRNLELIRGIRKYSQSKMYHKCRLWAIKAKIDSVSPHHEPKAAMPKPAEKPPKFYPTDDVKKPISNRCKLKPTKLRPRITPGTALILLVGMFMGKRVVFTKQLPSGLLLVTGEHLQWLGYILLHFLIRYVFPDLLKILYLSLGNEMLFVYV